MRHAWLTCAPPGQRGSRHLAHWRCCPPVDALSKSFEPRPVNDCRKTSLLARIDAVEQVLADGRKYVADLEAAGTPIPLADASGPRPGRIED